MYVAAHNRRINKFNQLEKLDAITFAHGVVHTQYSNTNEHQL